MKLNKHLIYVCAIGILFSSCKKEPISDSEEHQESKELLDRNQINSTLVNHLLEKGSVEWNDFTDRELVSAFNLAQTNVVTIAWPRYSQSDLEKEAIIE